MQPRKPFGFATSFPSYFLPHHLQPPFTATTKLLSNLPAKTTTMPKQSISTSAITSSGKSSPMIISLLSIVVQMIWWLIFLPSPFPSGRLSRMLAILGFAEIEGECWIFHVPTICAVACVGAQPLLKDALVHLQDFLEPPEPHAHSSVYFLSLCSTFLFHIGHLSSPVHPLLSQSQGRMSTSL